MTGPQQLPLPLPARDALGREAFFVSPSNALAVAQVEAWETWPACKMVLAGPAGSGKTHLAHVWAGLARARIIPATDLATADIPDLAQGPICIEDIEDIAGDRPSEEALFHLHNMLMAQQQALLVTASREPARWELAIPDLHSRMMAAQLARLDDPDDALLAALLVKLFHDRQLTPAPDVVAYLVRHMPRSHAMARAVVADLDAEGLAQGRAVSRPMAVRVLDRLAADRDPAPE